LTLKELGAPSPNTCADRLACFAGARAGETRWKIGATIDYACARFFFRRADVFSRKPQARAAFAGGIAAPPGAAACSDSPA